MLHKSGNRGGHSVQAHVDQRTVRWVDVDPDCMPAEIQRRLERRARSHERVQHPIAIARPRHDATYRQFLWEGRVVLDGVSGSLAEAPNRPGVLRLQLVDYRLRK